MKKILPIILLMFLAGLSIGVYPQIGSWLSRGRIDCFYTDSAGGNFYSSITCYDLGTYLVQKRYTDRMELGLFFVFILFIMITAGVMVWWKWKYPKEN